MKKRNKGKWHYGFPSDGGDRAFSVCGTRDCYNYQFSRREQPRLKDRCRLCSHIAKQDSLFGVDDYFWYRQKES